MSLSAETITNGHAPVHLTQRLSDGASVSSAPAFHVIRRNGSVSPFEAGKIAVAMTKAFLAVEGHAAAASRRVHEIVEELTVQVVSALTRRVDSQRALHIEDIQDQVELSLMRGGHHKAARAYVLYREERAKARRDAVVPETSSVAPALRVKGQDGTLRALDEARLQRVLAEACDGLDGVSAAPVLAEARRNLYDGMTADELAQALVMAARTLIEQEPNYAYVSARLLLDALRREALTFVFKRDQQASQADMAGLYADYFKAYIDTGISHELLDPELRRFDLGRLAAALKPERDQQFQFLGLQTLYDRYFLHADGTRFELPQAFFMRVAMGVAVREIDREARAIEFYDLLSSFDFMASTPTLFNAGTLRPQLSSCFLTTVSDDLDGIFKSIKDNALLAKYSGGLGNDWTRVRGLGAHIKGTNGESQGVVPFLKVANDTAIAVNQGGKRKGAVCAYLETWHVDIEEFLDLRKNTGDDRRRTHDMNTANWVPDLFMQRVASDGPWTLFSPDETPDLHDLYGPAFAAAYEGYETKAARGEMRVSKTLRAVDLWRRMLTMLFETGHPWITFKDPCNIRSPQNHIGVVHSSNLCTEITLNTSDTEVAVCNLGSVNLAAHVTPQGLDHDKLARTVKTAVRMLDNVIDVNFYTIPEARRSNLQHRPVGLGLMGFHDALQTLRLPYASDEAVTFADTSMEALSFHAISASVDLAAERGRYASFEGSLWSRGILPVDSIAHLSAARGGVAFNQTTTLDWEPLRARVQKVGMRNSNVMAIAPTATISNICGVAQSIEPAYQNLYVKSNMSGDFTVVNAALVHDLKARGLWDEVMISDLKYFDGSVGQIDRVPDDLKALYATAFEIDTSWLIEAAARRQKWIDQAQSLNLYIANPSGRKLDQLYRLAWERGLKTTYYLRSRSATHVEKSTLKGTDGKLNAVTAQVVEAAEPILLPQPLACSINDPDCEACQ
ncbi:ribonucleoside-diphosphate reductase subunit alpha [Bradyrhizobium sp. U87765 SZCCT0131]|uniref:ribonucleoside-diphosphate reductase subunit alpha n=1 Tax=unclassified Bradyrhizobium TaxID=2631580 RepID=UPI001BA86C88|nr:MULTISPECIES: ribonucleoside-diphosphate reductase subunit alpha [unclassified Bradyrhizobium]MBR1221144.1 ribonucleoside-diphosphate reductase subunit alpha [Bradyrhizobium sp. U87765 SZCCT0131]MBR1260035.1 ribonucleoside-diphosphate reductase subunit alpha [Bradyrhizobium sp. U87765 SZCCT0134]MBR1307716.1 ribonucleoside-diphosphate reductase subunit alpha [Bradyrhizobium sp. U87765 SZCCT0110]MBR1321670.1 ribonucleoside-diphosphate reductase subunit alpha [Bradyrhizobium sp. U87765 SZCCT010